MVLPFIVVFGRYRRENCVVTLSFLVSKVTYPEFDPLGVSDLFFDSFRRLVTFDGYCIVV
jgi:hypothetical protein